MVRQKVIPLKADMQLYAELEAEVMIQGKKRNRIINEALSIYFDIVELNRALSHVKHSPDDIERLFVKLRDYPNTMYIYWYFDYVPGDFLSYIETRRMIKNIIRKYEVHYNHRYIRNQADI